MLARLARVGEGGSFRGQPTLTCRRNLAAGRPTSCVAASISACLTGRQNSSAGHRDGSHDGCVAYFAVGLLLPCVGQGGRAEGDRRISARLGGMTSKPPPTRKSLFSDLSATHTPSSAGILLARCRSPRLQVRIALPCRLMPACYAPHPSPRTTGRFDRTLLARGMGFLPVKVED